MALDGWYTKFAPVGCDHAEVLGPPGLFVPGMAANVVRLDG